MTIDAIVITLRDTAESGGYRWGRPLSAVIIRIGFPPIEK